jgi:hypothetical protein
VSTPFQSSNLYYIQNIGGFVFGHQTPRSLYPRKLGDAHCIEGWVDPRTDLDGCGQSSPKRAVIRVVTTQSQTQTAKWSGCLIQLHGV